MHHHAVNKEILARENFIWRDLIRDGQKAVKLARELWKKNRSIPRMLFSWPAEHVRAADGKTITHLVSFAIPDEMGTAKAAIMLAKDTKSYALALVERDGSDLRVLLESMHGTRCWRVPIKRHGDVEVLGKDSAPTVDTESIGVLWRRGMNED